LFVFGGTGCGFEGALDEGALYDPATDTWKPITRLGAPAGRIRPATVWTGRQVIVWGGERDQHFLGDGALYDPSSDSWTEMDDRQSPAARGHLAAVVWTGMQMLVWGGIDAGREVLASGGLYTPPLSSLAPFGQ
jgi:N-acetylneuraminic acid mutarotase